MKNKLLFIAMFAMFCINSFAQATAYEVPDLTYCGNDPFFDLTVQTPVVLGNQSPDDFVVTYYHTEANAQAGASAISNPSAVYVPSSNEEIFIRVENATTGDFDVTSFFIYWSQIFTPWNDVTVCTSFELPTISWPQITFYTGPNGTGTVVPGGTVISASQTLYAVQSGACSNEWSFNVIVAGSLPDADFEPITMCDQDFDGFATFFLEMQLSYLWSSYPDYQNINIELYETEADAQNEVNQIWDYVYTNTTPNQQTIYVRLIAQDCVSIEPITLIVAPCITDNTIAGNIRYDSDDNGCSETDLAAAGITVYYVHDNNYYYTTTDEDGNYSFLNIPDGEVTVYPNPAYPFTAAVAPQNYSFTFPGNEEDVNFCLTEQQPTVDVAVYTFPFTSFVPGFPATYVIAYQNTGSTTVASGDVTLSFDDSLLNYEGASSTALVNGNQLTFSYTNLQPYQTQYIYVNFTLSTTAVSGNILDFNTTITPLNDNSPYNNTFDCYAFVVSSFDPNDISVREGESITLDQTGEYLHYTIRFQNMGDANATFVRIATNLNENLDLDTFQAIGGSHNFVANRAGNSLEFFFDDINLPFEDADEPGSHGFVSFKVKPKATVGIGDVMTGQAGIYFDFNPVVDTNTATTTVQATAGIKDLATNGFALYPNPASGKVTLLLQNAEAGNITVTDILGKTMFTAVLNGAQSNLDVSALKTGVYFVSVTANGKQSTKKLVIK